METLKIYLVEKLLVKYYAIKHLMLLKIQNMTAIKEILLQCFKNFLIKSPLLVVVLKMKIYQSKN